MSSTATVSISRWRASIAARLVIWRSIEPASKRKPHPFKTHPRREVLLADNAHPPEKFGCTGCHEGQGVAVNSVNQAHGEVHLWEFPLLRGAKVQSSCTSCHLDVQKFAEDAPLLAEGQRLFEQVGCTGCHLVKGYENIPKIAPSLMKISAKVDPSWMVRWIENPHKFRPRTRMPNFELKQDDALAIAAYIWSQSKEEGDKWTKEHPVPVGLSAKAMRMRPRKGKKLVETIGCKGCHGFADGEFSTPLGKAKDLVPNLKDIAAKDRPAVDLPLDQKSARLFAGHAHAELAAIRRRGGAITTYLMTLGPKPDPMAGIEEKLADANNIKRGESLVRRWGCFGCHDIKGMEKESRIGAELTTFGSKTVEELSFGNRTDVKHTWDDWTYNKLKSPRGYATERVEQLMPQFDLADEDIKALRTVARRFPRAQSRPALPGRSRVARAAGRRRPAVDAAVQLRRLPRDRKPRRVCEKVLSGECDVCAAAAQRRRRESAVAVVL